MAPRYALIVGISQYKSLPQLSKPAIDAAAVKQHLETCGGYQDIRLLQGAVTGEALEAALIELLQQRATGAEAFIYFTGHGFVVQEGQRKQRPYFATSDCQVTFDKRDRTQVIGQLYGYSFESFNELVQVSTVNSLVVLLDCCHSGALLALAKQSLTAFNAIDKDYFLIAACRAFEEAAAYKSQPHSIFTGAVLEGLRSDNADSDGQVTSDRLYDYVRQQLVRSGQEPIRMGTGRAITLVHYRRQVATTQIDETCPYQGLEPFTEATQQFFFGRKPIVELLRQELERSPFVALIGASGSGKSSVVRAGLIPWVKTAGWRILDPIKPGFEPLSELKRAFANQFRRPNEIQEVYGAIASGSLDAAVALLPGAERVLLVVDQFEEIFTVCTDEEKRRSIIHLITQLQDSRLAVVITMRADFLEPCLNYANLTQQLQQHTVLIPPLEGKALEEAIAQPAQKQGYTVESALLSLIQRDVAQEKNCLPLLQFALQSLWSAATEAKHHLRLDHYENLGGISGALNRHANRVYNYQDWRDATPNQPRNPHEQDWIKRLCLKLVRTGDNTRDTRQRQPKADLLALAEENADERSIVEAVLADLVDGRLLVTDHEESNQNQVASASVDLAHEALLDGWTRFAEWRNEHRELRRLVDRMDDARREWEHQSRHVDFLLPKGLLAQIKLQEASIAPYLTSRLREFYTSSKDYEQRQSDALEWAKTEAALAARAREAKNLLNTRPVEGLLQILKLVGVSLQERGEPISAIQDGLRSAMELCREQNCFQGHQSSVTSVAYHPDGTMIASGSKDGAIKLWDVTGQLIREFFNGRHHSPVTALEFSPDGRMLATAGDRIFYLHNLNGEPIGDVFQGHWDQINSVSFSPNDQLIVSGSRDGTLRLWDLAGNLISQPFRGHRGAVFSVHFNASGQAIASSGADGTIRLWNLQGEPIGQPLQGHEGAVQSVRFNPDGLAIVSGGSDRTVRLWNRQRQLWSQQAQPIGKPFEEQTNTIQAVAFSPDGKTIASANTDKTIRLWNLQGEAIATPFIGHDGLISSLAFSPDSKMIVSGSVDATVRLWSLDSSPIGQLFQRHEGSVKSVAFSPDGTRIVSGSDDRTIHLWDLQGNLIGQPFQEHEDSVMSVAFSPDGTRIISGSLDRTIRLWNLQGNSIGQPFQGHESAVMSVAFSPDGNCIVSGSLDRTIRLWDLQGNLIGQLFWGHEGAVRSVAFSPDSTRIVSGSVDRTIRLWDLQGNPIGQPFQGHESSVWSVAFSPDGTRIVSGSADGTIRLWDLQGNLIGQPFQGHEGFVISIAISPHGNCIASGSDDTTIHLWDLQGNPIGQPLQGHNNFIWSIAFSPDGNCIVSSSDDKTIRLWFGWHHWLAMCCNHIRHHPYFKNPQTQNAKAACEVCQKYVWSKLENEKSRE